MGKQAKLELYPLLEWQPVSGRVSCGHVVWVLGQLWQQRGLPSAMELMSSLEVQQAWHCNSGASTHQGRDKSHCDITPEQSTEESQPEEMVETVCASLVTWWRIDSSPSIDDALTEANNSAPRWHLAKIYRRTKPHNLRIFVNIKERIDGVYWLNIELLLWWATLAMS